MPYIIHVWLYMLILVMLCLQLPALRTLGNIVTGTDQQTQAVLDGDILPHLHSLMRNSRPTIVRVSRGKSFALIRHRDSDPINKCICVLILSR